MAIAIRGTTPATTETVSNPVSLTLTGSRQPNTNDVLVIIHFNDFYALSNMPTPTVGGSSSGVTAITNGTYDRGTDQTHGKSYTYVVGSTGDLTVSVTETGTADEEKALAVYVLSGVDNSTPIDVAGNAISSVDDTSPDAPSVSPTSSDAFLICHVSEFGDAGTYTPPGGMTEQYDDGGSLSFTGATEQLVTSGATGVKTFASTNVQGWGCLSIAVKTASALTPGFLDLESTDEYLLESGDFLALETTAAGANPNPPTTTSISRTEGRLLHQRFVAIASREPIVGPVTGTIAITQDDQTSSASGTVVNHFTGTIAVTQEDQTSSATGVLGYSGTIAVTQDNQTSAASGVVGEVAIPTSVFVSSPDTAQRLLRQPPPYFTDFGPPTVAVEEVTGTIAVTQADQTSAATGTVTAPNLQTPVFVSIPDTSVRLLHQPSLWLIHRAPIAVSAEFTGTIAVTQDDQISAASGTVVNPITGTIAVLQDDQTSSAAGTVTDPAAPDKPWKLLGGGGPIRRGTHQYLIRRPGWS